MSKLGARLLGIIFGGAYVLGVSSATAQITSDRTLPNNSNVTNNGSVFNITGGTQAGRNLFHSFQQFSVPANNTAFFNNTADIHNIFSRVTGGSVSDIEGVIRANATANVFLINPNGIVFGKNASLSIGGSFVASTANSLKFADGFEYSAIAPQATPLLTISVPSGLQFGTNPGSIQVQGDSQGIRTTSNLIDTSIGLRVQPNQTLALVGGDINLEGATLKTAGGRIELGSVAGNGLVSLTSYNKGFSLSYDYVQNFGNIRLSKQAAVDASGEGGGDIQVWGRNVTLTNGSQIEASTLGSSPGGSLVVNAQDSVQLIGISANPSSLFADVYKGATGAGGNLIINTHQLSVQGGAEVGATTFGGGKGGSLNVTADSIQLTGISTDGQSASGLFTQADLGSTGDAGNLTINTHQLTVQDGARVSATTFGAGKGGDLIINDTGQLLVQGGAQVSASTFGAGNSGNVNATANEIRLTGTSTDGQSISGLFAQAALGSTGDAGNLIINTHQLAVQDGARVSASTLGISNSGNLNVTADSIQLTGTSTDSRVPGGLSAQTNPGSTGNAGNLTIHTQDLTVQNGATVSVSSPQGRAGDLTITAKNIRLNLGNLTATTAVTSPDQSGANITLQGLDLLFLRNNSLISARATSNTANGGNITIDALNGFVVAAPSGSNGSDIVASAFGGRGGNIQITTQSIYGLTSGRSIVGNGTNDIDASSQFNQAGTVTINVSDIDPSRGLVQLPTVVGNTPKLVSISCAAFADVGGSNFTITGRSGLPPSPDEPLSSDVVWSDTRLPVTTEQHQYKTHASKPKPQPIAIIPATGWVFNDKGEVTLISSVANASTLNTPTSCPAR